MRVDASCGETTVEGRFLGNLYYRSKVFDVLTPSEYSGFPNNGGEHTLILHLNEADLMAFLVLIEECYGHVPGCREFVRRVINKMPTDRVIIHANRRTKKFFFSTEHCQTAPEGFVPSTSVIPQCVVSRPSLPDGVIRSREDLVMIFHTDQREIPNPNPLYQA